MSGEEEGHLVGLVSNIRVHGISSEGASIYGKVILEIRCVHLASVESHDEVDETSKLCN